MVERDAWLLINLVAQSWNQKWQKLAKHFGGVAALLKASVNQWQQFGLKNSQIQKLKKLLDSDFVAEENKRLKQFNVDILTWASSDYPMALRQIADPPCVLYVKGDKQCLQRHALAIIGSRQASYTGRDNTAQVVRQLSGYPFVIISGLARGIDGAAHQAAIQNGLPTVAVLGHGLGTVYPSEHRTLAKKIVESKGLLVSEFPLLEPPKAFHFPRRNRIISGLSEGVLIIEAKARSGALITADLALEEGRNVYALPGPWNHPLAQGCHTLLQQGAKLVMDIDDILEDYDLSVPSRHHCLDQPDQACATKVLPLADDDGLEKLLRDWSPQTQRSLAEMTAQCDSDAATLLKCLMLLELKGLIRQLPGQSYQRL